MIHPRHPGQSRIDDRAHARHGQARLGDRGGQHDPAARTRSQHRVLLTGRAGGRATGTRSDRRAGRPSAGSRPRRAGRPAHRRWCRPCAVRTRARHAVLDAFAAGAVAGSSARPDRSWSAPAPLAWWGRAVRPVASVATVAEVASSRRSGRRPARASNSNASSRSASRWRSWHSSSRTASTPGNSGSPCNLRSSRPDVTTSIRVALDVRRSPRTA